MVCLAAWCIAHTVFWYIDESVSTIFASNIDKFWYRYVTLQPIKEFYLET